MLAQNDAMKPVTGVLETNILQHGYQHDMASSTRAEGTVCQGSGWQGLLDLGVALEVCQAGEGKLSFNKLRYLAIF